MMVGSGAFGDKNAAFVGSSAFNLGIVIKTIYFL
jgi:hypothetical protein